MTPEPRRVLAVGAHFDDVELGCGGTLLKHVDAGDAVTVAVVTRSGYRAPDGTPVRDDRAARQEGEAAAAALGCSLVCFDFETFKVPDDESLTAALSQLITRLGVDTLYQHWTGDVHRDHRNAARCCLMAGRHLPRLLMYRSNFYPSDGAFRGTLYSDISAVIDRKLDLLSLHASELGRRPEWVTLFRDRHRADGLAVGLEYAEVFEAVRYRI